MIRQGVLKKHGSGDKLLWIFLIPFRYSGELHQRGDVDVPRDGLLTIPSIRLHVSPAPSMGGYTILSFVFFFLLFLMICQLHSNSGWFDLYMFLFCLYFGLHKRLNCVLFVLLFLTIISLFGSFSYLWTIIFHAVIWYLISTRMIIKQQVLYMILWYTRDEPSCYLHSSFRLESRSYDHITSGYGLTYVNTTFNRDLLLYFIYFVLFLLLFQEHVDLGFLLFRNFPILLPRNTYSSDWDQICTSCGFRMLTDGPGSTSSFQCLCLPLYFGA